jgi:transcriptional regulator with XRE-family HTH domain
MPKKKSKQLKEICVTIGLKIRHRRLKIGMTRKIFAFELELSSASISNIEKGKQSVSAEKLWHVALVLGCPPGDLLPAVPEEYQLFEEQLKEIDNEKTRKWGQELIKHSQA